MATAFPPIYIPFLAAYLVWIIGICWFPIGKTTMVVFTPIIPLILVFYRDYWYLALILGIIVLILALGYGKAEGSANSPIKKPLPVIIVTFMISTALSLLFINLIRSSLYKDNAFAVVFVVIFIQLLFFMLTSAITTYFIGSLFIKKVQHLEGTLNNYQIVRHRKSSTITASFSGTPFTFKFPYGYRYRFKNKVNAIYSYKIYHCSFGLISIGNIKLLDDSEAQILLWEAEEAKRFGKLTPFFILLIGFAIVIVASNLFFLLA